MSINQALAAAEVHQVEGPSADLEWGYRNSNYGVEWRDKNGKWHWLCESLEIAADTRDVGSKNWGRQLSFKDRDGVGHQLIVSAADLSRTPSDVIATIAGQGFVPPVSARDKQLLIGYILTACPEARLRVVSRVGWEGKVFVLPDIEFGADTGEKISFQCEGMRTEHSYRVAGDLTDWQIRIAKPSAGNSRLAFAISCAFTGPLLYLLGEEGGGFHLRGGSSIGKSTALKVGGSVWGGGGVAGFIRNWRATDNGLEGVAMQHCDTFLALDEISQVDGRAAAAVAYMLANGQGKSRAGKTGEARPTAAWRVLFLSTGEISLAVKISEDARARKFRAGQEVRVLDIPADAGAGFGLFDHLPDGIGGDAFADDLTLAASEVYGTPARAYLQWLCANLDKAKVAARSIQKQMLEELVGPDDDGQVKRAANRFALVAAAGELATLAGVTSWKKGEACQAVTACFNAWLEARGCTGPAEIRDGIKQVRLFLEKHGASRFQNWYCKPETVPNRAGFVKNEEGSDGVFYILATVWTQEICQGRDAKAIAEAMIERGFLEPGPDGKASQSLKVPAMGKSVRLYCINAGIFEGASDG